MISAFSRLSAVAFAVLAIAGCSMGGGGQLSAGLSQRMDMPGVQLNRGEAIGIINNYRS